MWQKGVLRILSPDGSEDLRMLLRELELIELSEKQVVDLDDERRAAMVSNLMTVLCAESEVQPVINTGTLYN